MYITAQPLYKNIDIDFFKLHRIVKSDKVQYSPFEYSNNKKIGENWNNDKQNILILDIDDGLSISEAMKIFRDFKYLICTTKSHQKDKKGIVCDRFRIILEAVNVPIGDIYFKYMESLKLLFPFIDEQVNTKTGAFLGYSKCEYWYNHGQKFDFKILKLKQEPKKEIVNRDSNYDIEITQIKERLTPDIVRDILNAHGFEVDRNYKLKLRNERTPSTSISRDCLIKDFGSDFTGDVFSVLMEYRNMSFKDSVAFVGGYI